MAGISFPTTSTVRWKNLDDLQLKTYHLFLKVYDLLSRHFGDFTLGWLIRVDAGLLMSEGISESIHYIGRNFAGLGFVCDVCIFVEGEIKVHQIAGDSQMF